MQQTGNVWNWLIKPKTPYTWRFMRNVALKGLILFGIVNLMFALLNPISSLARFSLYNRIVPGRLRLPYGENPDQSYNLSLNTLDALFASHEIAGTPKTADEYRVLLIGDSSIWGVLLNADQTLAADLNAAGYHTADGKRVRVYNLGYPIQSLTRDVLFLQYAMRYQPDLILWSVTLESFAPSQQLLPLVVQTNPDAVRKLISTYGLKIDPANAQFKDLSLWDRTIIGQRRTLADLLRLQLYGGSWAITHIDQRYPNFYEPRVDNFDTDTDWHGFKQSDTLTMDNIAFDALRAGITIAKAGQVPILIVNEPIFISSGKNSDLRYDGFYPRWAYDTYRELMVAENKTQGWNYLDLWNAIPADQFTDSALHMQPGAVRQLADRVGMALIQVINTGKLSALLR